MSTSDKSELRVGKKVNCGLLKNFLVIFAIITILVAPITTASAITFDPPVTIPNPTPAAGDKFGTSVAISGTRVVVGAPFDTSITSIGFAYVYDCTPVCGVPVIIPNPAVFTDDRFGHSVAISGTRVVVGAPLDDTGALNAGAAYVYDCTPACGAPVTISNPTPVAGDQFGFSVAISGTRVLVGANLDDTGAADAGAAYLYDCTPACGAPITIGNPTPDVSDLFGHSVAISGTRVVVGAFGDNTGAANAGAAYVFVCTTFPLCTAPVTISNPTPAVNDQFGQSVAISGTMVLVGAFLDDTGAVDAGAAYVYDCTPACGLPTTIPNPTPAANKEFGTSVAISGTRVVVGVQFDNTGAIDAGAAYLFVESATDTTPPTVITSVSDNFITDADDPATFTVVSSFNEPMAVATTPVITFTQVVADTLGLTGGVWSVGNTVYTTSYDIDVASQELDNVVAATTAAKDVAGNPQNPDASAAAARTFDVDTVNPTVVSITVDQVLISDSDAGFTFHPTIVYSEPMDETLDNPTVVFDPDVTASPSTLIDDVGGFINSVTFEGHYDMFDVGVTVPDVDITVSGAKDLAGNVQISFTETDAFDIDTENPTVSIAYSDNDLFTTDLYAKSGTLVTLTATASETLAGAPTITISGANSAGPTPMTPSGLLYTFSYTAGAGDGTATISLSGTTDVAGNLIVSAPTSGGAFFIDNTAPVGTIAIERTDSDPSASTERTYVRSVNLDTTCSDPALPGPVLGSSCDLVDITGTGLVGESPGNFEAISDTRAATLTEFRGVKGADATLRDKAGNTATFSDTIALDARIVGITVTDDTPFWEVDVTFDGTVNNALATDTITFDFGSPTQIIAIAGGDVNIFTTVADSYPQITLDSDNNPHEPSATLVNSLSANVVDSLGATVTTAGPIVTVQAHPTAITSDVINDPNQASSFFVGGRLSDTLFSVPVTGKLITFGGAGAPSGLDPLDPYTTQGITFTDADLDGVVIDSCLSCLPAFPDNIMRLDAGAKIFPPEGTVYTLLQLQDMGSESVTFRVTNGESPPVITELTRAASASEIILLSLTDPFEVVEIEIFSVTGSGAVGLSSVKTVGSQLGVINDIDFTTQTTGLTTSLTFDASRFYAEGTAQTAVAEFLPLDEIFGGDADYVTTTTTVTYSVLPLPSAGIGGTTVPVQDSGVGFYGILCPAGTDTDKDALCNGWEESGANAGSGVPFTVAGLATQYYPLPGTITTTNNTLVEIDYMVPHTPLDSALTLAATSFAAQGVTLIDTVDDEIPHQYLTRLWGDQDAVDNNDFNSLKNDYFGTASERPTMSLQADQLETFANGPDSITVSGITILVPTNSITSGATQGNITARVNITCSTSCGTVTVGTITQPADPTLEGGVNLGTITASASTTPNALHKRITITYPFTTTGPTSAPSTVIIPDITIPLTVSPTITDARTVSGSPSVQTTLLNAKAQAYRYGIFAHSFGGPSGQSETKGNDFVVTLGQGFSGSVAGHTGSVGSSVEQAGTYVHELGHILNLQHGGAVSTNCKPNYPSVMSYARQMDTYVGATWTPSFSPGGHASIAEGTAGAPLLAESIDGDSNLLNGLASEIIVYGAPLGAGVAPAHAAPNHSFHAVAGDVAAIDWNDSSLAGVGGPSSPLVYADISNVGFIGCQATANGATAFVDYIDKALFNFNFRDAPGGLFDGISLFVADLDAAVRWQQIIGAGVYGGLSAPPPNADGSSVFNRGATVPHKLQVENQLGQVIDTPEGHFKMFVAKASSLTSACPIPTSAYSPVANKLLGTNPALHNDAVWKPEPRFLQYDLKTTGAPFTGAGKYCVRINIFDTSTPPTTDGLASSFLTDNDCSDGCLPNGTVPGTPNDRDKATITWKLKK